MKRLAALAAALIVAFVLAPGRLAGAGHGTDYADSGRLNSAFRGAFVTYRASGERAYNPGLRQVVDYWFRFHIAKGLISTALLAVLIVVGVLIWRRFLHEEGIRAVGLAAGGILTTALAVFSLAAAMANIQGVAAPFGSLLPVLIGDSTGPVTAALKQASHQLATGGHSPGLEAVISDYVLYHAVMAVQAAIVAVVLLAVTVVLWRRFSRADGRARKLFAAYGVFVPLLVMFMSVLVVANSMTTADPLPGLQNWLAGGW